MQIEDHLTLIKNKMATGERDGPERLLKDLIGQMGPAELLDWRPDIDRIVNEFLPKRRRNLREMLDERNRERSISDQRKTGTAGPRESPSISPVSTLATEFRNALDDLRVRQHFPVVDFLSGLPRSVCWPIS